MNQPQALRKTAGAALCATVLGAVLLPGAVQAAEADLAKKIDALQQELEALKAQMKASPPAAAGGGVATAPGNLKLDIYGVGHLSADSIKTGTDSSSYFHSNSSRLGFKGDYALGNGLSAIFQYESGVDLTGNGTGDGNGGGVPGNTLFTRTRDSFVGITGGFGTAVVGRLPAHNQWLYDYNLFGDQVGDLGNLWGQNQPGRVDSAVLYRTPDFGGFSAALSYDPSGNQGAKDMSSTILKLDFARGGLKVGGAHANYGLGTGLSKQKATALIASYDFGMFNIGGGVQRERALGGLSGVNQNESTIGALVKVGANGAVKFQYARASDVSGTANTGARQAAIGYDHAWNKETTLYVAYAKTSNDAAAAFQSYNWGHGNQGVPAVVAGNSPKALSVGIVYKFDVGLLGKR